MDPLTHLSAGVALSQFVPAPSRGVAALAGALFAVLPDLDYVLIFHNRLSYLRHHRGFSHSLVAMALFVLAGAWLGRLLGGPRWSRPMFLIGLVVVASHLFLDWLTSYGTQLLNPFTRAKFSLDWVFIIDPYLTGLLFAGAVAAAWSGSRGRLAGAVFLALAGAYILLCGFYHQQALKTARTVFQENSSPPTVVAALPQPLSPRRWLLMAAAPGKIRQAFVELPVWPRSEAASVSAEIPVRPASPDSPRIPPAPYRDPGSLEVFLWQEASWPSGRLTSEARGLLDIYLEFSRFPLLIANDPEGSGVSLTWLDLRFSVPGREVPFLFRLQVGPHYSRRR